MKTEEESGVPWYVQRRVPLEKVREWVEQLKTTATYRPAIPAEEFRRRVQRLRRQGFTFPSNTFHRCPGCGRRLWRFPITSDRDVLKRAKEDPEVRRIISGYVCWACVKTCFEPRGGWQQKLR